MGNLPDFARDPLGFLAKTARDHGPVSALRFGRSRALLLNDPALIEEVLVGRRASFIKSRPLRAQRRLFGNGLLTNDGESWLRQRRLAQPAFHPGQLSEHAGIVIEQTRRMLDTWHAGEIRDFHEDMKRLLMCIVAEALFGSSVSVRAAAVGAALEAAMDRYASRRGLSRFVPDWAGRGTPRRFLRGIRDIEAFVAEIVAARRTSRDAQCDLLSMLLAARDESGEPMSETQIRDEAVTLFVGGFDTPALTMSWTWYLLARHPLHAATLAAELDAALGGRTPGYEDLPRLPFTQNVIRESMRLYPPAWLISREAAEDVYVGTHMVRRGTSVLMSQWVMHRDERYFTNPLDFEPGRWNNGASSRLPRFAYFPFGGGPRVCIGAAFAMMETTLALAMIGQRFRFEMANDSHVVPRATMTLRPGGGMPFRVVPR